APQEHTPPSSAALASPWEVTTGSRVEGIFLFIQGSGPQRQINIRRYHREDARESSGWYSVGPNSAAEFDGERLRVVGLDATFQPDLRQWVGSWSVYGEGKLAVTLKRPRPGDDATPNPFCGDWEATSESAS